MPETGAGSVAGAGSGAGAGTEAGEPRPVPTGSSELSGRILGLDGAGLAGVLVEVVGDGTIARTTSGADGAYGFLTLPAGVFRLRVSGPGITTAELARVKVPGRNVAVAVSRRVGLAGRVVGGSGPAVVEIASTALAEPRELTTAPDGAFELSDLPEGRFRVSARRGGEAGELTGIVRFGAGPFPPVELRVGPASTIVGRVVVDGAGVPGAWIVLEPGEDELTARRARSDGTGAFRVEGVVPGSWSLDVEAVGVVLPAPVAVEALPSVEVRVEVSMARATAVAGEVEDLSGQPVAGAEITLIGEDGVWSAATRARRRAWIEGRALGRSGKLVAAGELGVLLGPIPYPPPLGASQAFAPAEDRGPAEAFVSDGSGRFALTSVRPGKWRVRARHVDFAPAEADAGPAVRLVLRRGATIAGTVTDGRGPRGGVRVVVGEDTTFTDDAGRFQVPHVLGDVTVRALPRGEPAVGRLIAIGDADEGRTLDASLVLGDSAQAVTADSLGSLALDIRDASTVGPIREFEVKATGPGATVKRAGKNGELRLDALAPGVWRIAVTARSFARREVEVTVTTGEPTRARIDLVQGATVAGIVYDEHGESVGGAEVACGGVTGTTSPTGAFRLVGVPPGEVAITARHPERGHGETWIPLRGGDDVLSVQVRIGLSSP